MQNTQKCAQKLTFSYSPILCRLNPSVQDRSLQTHGQYPVVPGQIYPSAFVPKY